MPGRAAVRQHGTVAPTGHRSDAGTHALSVHDDEVVRFSEERRALPGPRATERVARARRGDRPWGAPVGSLLRAARLLRRPAHCLALGGHRPDEVEMANCPWGVYQMIGELAFVVDVPVAA